MRLPDQIKPRPNNFERELHDIVQSLDHEAFAAGIQLSLENDFAEMKRVSDALDKLPLTPNFDTARIGINPTNGFWMRGVDTSGDTVFMQGARMYDCAHTTIALLHETLRAFYDDPNHHAEPGETCASEAPAAHGLTGRVCYHGELWLDAKYRGQDLPRVFARLLMAIVLWRWRPDCLFGMAQPGICKRGVAARYGYANLQPHGMIWTVPSRGTLDEWIIWNSGADLLEAVSRP